MNSLWRFLDDVLVAFIWSLIIGLLIVAPGVFSAGTKFVYMAF